MTCVGAGIPEPQVAWLINGSTISPTKRQNTINAKVDSILPDIENGTNVHRTISKIVITGIKFPLSIQCVVENHVGKSYSKNIYTLYLKGMYPYIFVLKCTSSSFSYNSTRKALSFTKSLAYIFVNLTLSCHSTV